jgi:hypothetical protein
MDAGMGAHDDTGMERLLPGNNLGRTFPGRLGSQVDILCQGVYKLRKRDPKINLGSKIRVNFAR